MKIKKVKVTSPIGDFGGRTLEVKTDKFNFETPTRAISGTELGYKKNVGCDEAFDNVLFDTTALFEYENIQQLHTKNGYYRERKNKISSKIRELEGDALTRVHIQDPYKRNLTFTDKDLKFIVELQMSIKPDFIELPDDSINSKPDKFEKKILELGDLVYNETNSIPFPVIDMAMEEETFEEKYKAILDNKETFPTLGVIWRPFDDYAANYGYLWDNRDKDIWIHAVGVNRTVAGGSTNYVAIMHKLQRFGIDTCTRLTRLAPGGKPTDRDKIKRFDSSSLGIVPLSLHKSIHGEDLKCSCPVCNGLDLSEYKGKYSYNIKGNYDLLALTHWNQIHEVFSSTEEFDISRKHIKSDELKEYWNEKKYLD